MSNWYSKSYVKDVRDSIQNRLQNKSEDYDKKTGRDINGQKIVSKRKVGYEYDYSLHERLPRREKTRNRNLDKSGINPTVSRTHVVQKIKLGKVSEEKKCNKNDDTVEQLELNEIQDADDKEEIHESKKENTLPLRKDFDNNVAESLEESNKCKDFILGDELKDEDNLCDSSRSRAELLDKSPTNSDIIGSTEPVSNTRVVDDVNEKIVPNELRNKVSSKQIASHSDNHLANHRKRETVQDGSFKQHGKLVDLSSEDLVHHSQMAAFSDVCLTQQTGKIEPVQNFSLVYRGQVTSQKQLEAFQDGKLKRYRQLEGLPSYRSTSHKQIGAYQNDESRRHGQLAALHDGGFTSRRQRATDLCDSITSYRQLEAPAGDSLPCNRQLEALPDDHLEALVALQQTISFIPRNQLPASLRQQIPAILSNFKAKESNNLIKLLQRKSNRDNDSIISSSTASKDCFVSSAELRSPVLLLNKPKHSKKQLPQHHSKKYHPVVQAHRNDLAYNCYMLNRHQRQIGRSLKTLHENLESLGKRIKQRNMQERRTLENTGVGMMKSQPSTTSGRAKSGLKIITRVRFAAQDDL